MAARFAKIWHIVLGLVLIVWGLELVDILSIDDTILGIGAIVAGVLVLMNK